jgi:hypothetical protein
MKPILNAVVVSCVVEGARCEESGGHVIVYITIYYIRQGLVASPPWV